MLPQKPPRKRRQNRPKSAAMTDQSLPFDLHNGASLDGEALWVHRDRQISPLQTLLECPESRRAETHRVRVLKPRMNHCFGGECDGTWPLGEVNPCYEAHYSDKFMAIWSPLDHTHLAGIWDGVAEKPRLSCVYSCSVCEEPISDATETILADNVAPSFSTFEKGL